MTESITWERQSIESEYLWYVLSISEFCVLEVRLRILKDRKSKYQYNDELTYNWVRLDWIQIFEEITKKSFPEKKNVDTMLLAIVAIVCPWQLVVALIGPPRFRRLVPGRPRWRLRPPFPAAWVSRRRWCVDRRTRISASWRARLGGHCRISWACPYWSNTWPWNGPRCCPVRRPWAWCTRHHLERTNNNKTIKRA